MKFSSPRVLIVGYHELTHNYVSALKHTGIVPIVAFDDIVPTKEPFSEDSIRNDFDGLLLPGGGDINPIFFHESNTGSRNIDSPLDKMQFHYLEQFIRFGKPVLGICKGMQIINVYFGGSIIQDLPTASTHAWDKEDKIHSTTAFPNTFISNLYGNTLITNSAHHQGIVRLGTGLCLSQVSDDLVVEAIYHESLPIIGVQWHPERMSYDKQRNDTVDGAPIFHYYKELL
jgi:putative glutamine amidotransferase